jgi:hypothetical protein
MAMRTKWLGMVYAAREEAELAVNIYNDSTQTRSFEGFVVHMHLAWLYLLHARFCRDGVDYRYWSLTKPTRLERVDGEVKHWELAKCVKRRWQSDGDPTRKNLEFFIALRNKIEHRHSRFDEALAIAVAGKAQALLLNFEKELTTEFGAKFTMASILRFPLFIGTFTEAGTKTLKELRDRLPKDLQRFISEFHSGLPEEFERDPAFEIRLSVILQAAQRDPDALTMKFIHFDDLSDEEREIVEALGREGRTVIRERTRSVSNADLLKPSGVVSRVQRNVPFLFNMHHATQAWKKHRIRPDSGDPHPERTIEQYCLYDQLANTYGYTDAWVKRVIKYCQTAEDFEQFTGCTAVPCETIDDLENIELIVESVLADQPVTVDQVP